jgi:hypothetical protein
MKVPDVKKSKDNVGASGSQFQKILSLGSDCKIFWKLCLLLFCHLDCVSLNAFLANNLYSFFPILVVH